MKYIVPNKEAFKLISNTHEAADRLQSPELHKNQGPGQATMYDRPTDHTF
jgi:hypothetical protein